MDDRDRARDEIRAGAWKLAAIAGRNEAAKFVQQISDEIGDEQWKHRFGPNR